MTYCHLMQKVLFQQYYKDTKIIKEKVNGRS